MTFERILKNKRIYFIMLLLALWFGCIPSPSFALPVGSYDQNTTYLRDREIIDSFLAQELISEKLTRMGLSKDEIDSRLDKLSDWEIRQLAMRLEKIKAGSGGGWAIALAVVLLLIGMVFFFLTHTIHVEPKEPQAE